MKSDEILHFLLKSNCAPFIENLNFKSSFVHGNRVSMFNSRENSDESPNLHRCIYNVKHHCTYLLSISNIDLRNSISGALEMSSLLAYFCRSFQGQREFIRLWRTQQNDLKFEIDRSSIIIRKIKTIFTFNWIFLRFTFEWSANCLFTFEQNSHWRSEVTGIPCKVKILCMLG